MFNYVLKAFYGGTFDPIHYGHLQSAIVLAHLVNLQKVIFLPNNIPPHRPQPIASAQQRLAMVNLAIIELNNSLFTIDDRELRRPIYSWTIDTFKDLRYEYGPKVPLGFIIGQDSLLTLPQWHHGGLALLNLCHLLVCARPGYNTKLSNRNNDHWFTKLLVNDPKMLYQQPAGFIYYADTPQFAISASNIRARYREGLTCDGLLPSVVQAYINQHNLYR